METVVYWASMPISLFFILRVFYTSDFWGKHIRVLDVILGLAVSVLPVINTIFVIFFVMDIVADGLEVVFDWIMDIENSRISKFVVWVIGKIIDGLNHVVVENKK
jgi:hypothetical protein